MRLRCPVLFVCSLCMVAGAEEPVYFPDLVLKEAVERALHIWDPTPTDMLGLTDLRHVESFTTHEDGIADLSGIEHAVNLRTLNVRLNVISDLSPLAGLAQLQDLNLSQNRVSDLSPLSSLISLQHLNLHANRFADMSPLSGLHNIEYLNLHTNGIDDVSWLSAMTALETLILRYNDVSDISPLAGLANLAELDLCYNRIRDLSPLSGLSNLQQLDLEHNPVEDLSPLSGLNNLSILYVGRTYIRGIDALLGLTNLTRLDLEDNGLLGDEVYCSELQLMRDHVPDVRLEYSPNHHAPGDFSASDGIYEDMVRLTWGEVCNGPSYTTYYRVFRAAVGDEDSKTPVSDWQTELSFDDKTVEPGKTYTYWVQAAASSDGLGAGYYSSSDSGWSSDEPVAPLECRLSVSSTRGGSVTDPGEGTFVYEAGESVRLYAAAEPCYAFLRWSDGVTLTKNPAWIAVTEDRQIRAHFVSMLTALYVDDDNSADPGPVDASVSDPQENGTAAHPFDSIQEAIEVAAGGSSIVVRPGVYREKIDFLGKSIQVVGTDPNDPNNACFPVLDGSGDGPVVQFTNGEDLNCLLMGFVITRGQGDPAGAIYCEGSSPTIANCLIVGNRGTGLAGAAVYCVNSTAAFVNCTLADNVGGSDAGGLIAENSDVIVANSILWGNAPVEMAVRGVGTPAITYTDITGGWLGTGNIDVDPLFVCRGLWVDPTDPSQKRGPHDPNGLWLDGDYHVQSQAGRWDPVTEAWVQDELTSPCIDAGDPAVPVGPEPIPNRGIINLGAYGGTAATGRSPENF